MNPDSTGAHINLRNLFLEAEKAGSVACQLPTGAEARSRQRTQMPGQGTGSFMNIDCDLYSASKTVLDSLAPSIVPGTAIVIDEYVGNEHWREDVPRALGGRPYLWLDL